MLELTFQHACVLAAAVMTLWCEQCLTHSNNLWYFNARFQKGCNYCTVHIQRATRLASSKFFESRGYHEANVKRPAISLIISTAKILLRCLYCLGHPFHFSDAINFAIVERRLERLKLCLWAWRGKLLCSDARSEVCNSFLQFFPQVGRKNNSIARAEILFFCLRKRKILHAKIAVFFVGFRKFLVFSVLNALLEIFS